MPAAEHLRLLTARAGVLLDLVPPGSAYPRSLAAVTGLAVDRLEAENPAAADTNVCAFLAPEPVPGDEITQEAATYLAGARCGPWAVMPSPRPGPGHPGPPPPGAGRGPLRDSALGA
jgi:hypothetical protein